MAKEFDLFGRNASNLIGALGEIIAWDTLRKMGIWAYKIGSWSFFPEGYPHFHDKKLAFLTSEQAEFLKNKEANQIVEFDFLGVKCKHGFIMALTEEEIEGVYLIEVKAGRGPNIRHYMNNPTRAFSRTLSENFEKAKALDFKVALVVVELLENWKYRYTYREM